MPVDEGHPVERRNEAAELIHDDWAAVARVRSGDDAAFDAIMSRYKNSVHSFAFRMLGDAASADDAAQVVFLRAYQQICSGKLRKDKAAFSTWLFQVARCVALDELRRRKRHPSTRLSSGDDRGVDGNVDPRAADRKMIARETGTAIAAAVALLPPSQRTALVLAEYEGLPPSEIAAVMRCSLRSVETRLYRARRFLRQELAHLLE